MLKLSDIRMTVQLTAGQLRPAAAEVLQIPEAAIKTLEIQKLSTDARRKPDVKFVYTLLVTADGEREILRRSPANVSDYMPPEPYRFPFSAVSWDGAAVVAGTGPAGLFAALCLAEAGVRCIVLERGRRVEERTSDVERFWRTGELDLSSNVQFGEGGAGTFSDGKLTTGVNDRRIRFVLERLVEFGAPEDILYLSKPHVGTDKLRTVVKAARERLLLLGCDIRFGHTLCDIEVEDGGLRGITAEADGKTYRIETKHVLLAPGNSARDTFAMLARRGAALEAKSFSVGVRIEHLQSDINMAQYGAQPPLRTLPASDYKLAVHLGGGRSVYTFCVCPGGEVVASSSEAGGVVTNGMSHYARGGENCNGAVLVTINPGDFGGGALDGIEFQRKLERAAFKAGGESFYAPAQLAGDFLARRASTGAGAVTPTYRPGVKFCNLWDVLPEFVCEAIATALPEFDRRVKGFGSQDAVLTAVETRSSSPVRILREDFEAAGVRGLYPCGEGAGWAGGIMSAAVDGIKCAEALCGSIM